MDVITCKSQRGFVMTGVNLGRSVAARWLLAGVMLCLALPTCPAFTTEEPAALPEAAGAPVISGIVTDTDGRPAAEVTVTVDDWLSKKSVVTGADGSFSLPVLSDRSFLLLAENSDGSQLCLKHVQRPETVDFTELQLELLPVRDISVEVVDATGQPIEGATAGVAVVNFHSYFSQTNAAGKATIRVPAATELAHVFAFKNGLGVDFHTYAYANGRSIQPTDLLQDHQEQVRLTLEGARRVEVQVLDENQRPMPGVRVSLFVISKHNTDKFLVVRFPDELNRKTDQNGVVAFDIAPNLEKGQISLSAYADGYTGGQAYWSSSDTEERKKVVLSKLILLKGQVLNPDSTPAPGATVELQQSGEQLMQGTIATLTADAEGNFQAYVTPNLYCVLGAFHKTYASPVTAATAFAGKPIPPVILHLQPGARLVGKVPSVADDRFDRPRRAFRLTLSGPMASSLPKDQQLDFDDQPRLDLFHNVPLPEDGMIDTYAPPSYVSISAWNPGALWEPRMLLHEGVDNELVFTDIPPPVITAHGRVMLDQDPPVPAAGVPVICIGVDQYVDVRPVHTDANGEFEYAIPDTGVAFVAATADSQMAGIAHRKNGDNNAVELLLKPTATLKARVFHPGGFDHLKGGEAELFLEIHEPRIGPIEDIAEILGKKCRIDDEGYLTIVGVIPGYKFRCYLTLDSHSGLYPGTHVFQLDQPGISELMHLELAAFDAERADQLAFNTLLPQALAAKQNLLSRYETALKQAKEQGKQVLWITGKSRDPGFRRILGLSLGVSDLGIPIQPERHALMQKFVVLASDTLALEADGSVTRTQRLSQEALDQIQQLSGQLNVALDDSSRFNLVIVDAMGNAVASTAAEPLLTPNGYVHEPRLMDFLRQQAAE